MIEAERDDYMMRMSPESEFIWLAFMARFLSSIIFFLEKRRRMLFQNWGGRGRFTHPYQRTGQIRRFFVGLCANHFVS
jgi:hypothetical protein